MKFTIRLQLLLLACVMLTGPVFAQAPQPGYIPPDPAVEGLEAHNEHIAVLETTCEDFNQAVDLRDALVRNGAMVSIMTSPRRMLAWVPPASRDAVLATEIQSATGGSFGVRSVSYSSAEFEVNRDANRTMAAENDADRAIVEYLDFIKRPLTEADRERMRRSAEDIEEKLKHQQDLDCVTAEKTDMLPPRQVNSGIPAVDHSMIMNDGEYEFDRASAVRGYIVHTSFFLESKSGTGSWNWDNTVYTRYRNLYISAINFWSSFVGRYGKSITTHWRLYSPYSSATQVNGEPGAIGSNAYIPQVVSKVITVSWSNQPPSWNNLGLDYEWGWFYNENMRDTYDADESIMGFIAYKPSGDASIWPRAFSLIYGNGDRLGVWFQMDTRYSGNDPFSAPLRNVIAHEIGHLWGAPDEYKSDNCGWTYRGMPNVNCQSVRPAWGRSGNMRGWEGVMKGNYTGGSSLATAVHTGVINAGQAVPVRMFTSQPTGATLDFKNCDNRGNRSMTTPIGVPMDYWYCHRVIADESFFRGGKRWYFSHWRVERESGASTTIESYANELPSYALTSTSSNPVTDVEAVYTDDPPDIFSANNTVSAHFATAGGGGSPPPAVALKWRNNFDMDEAETIVEYEASPGNWKPLDGNHHLGRPNRVSRGQWTGVLILKVPNASGSGTTDIQDNRTYNFRVVGNFNNNRGNPSNEASITTRPRTPIDTVYCSDANEPNPITNPKVLSSSGPGMESYSIEGGIALQPLIGEFTFNVPQWDYFRITVIDVTPNIFGERVTLKLRVKDGSDFAPKFRAQRVGTTTHTYAYENDGFHYLSLTSDGEYIIKVESEVSGGAWNDLVNPTGGYFAFGEYEIEVSRTRVATVAELCVGCVKLDFTQPYPGEIIMRPHPLYDLFRNGIDKSNARNFNMYYQIPPGYSFQGFGGDFGNLKDNPAQISIGPNTETGTYHVYPIIERISNGVAELVVIHPEGPDGPIEDRQSTSIGASLTATATVPEGYEFVGWGGDTTATTNPLPVSMWRSKKLIAYYRPKPCVPEPMTRWQHEILFRNARQNEVTLQYGMQSGAGDGLEAGQTDLPPVPPPSAFDIRWLNIVGSQGSLTDIRAIKSTHIFQGQVQTGSTNPVTMTWSAPPASPAASYTLKIQGVPGDIDMRTETSHTFSNEGRYIFTVEVTEPQCSEPTKENEVVVIPDGMDKKHWPCVDLKLKIRDRRTGELRPFYNPYNLKVMQRASSGELRPTQVNSIIQLDSLLIYRICPDPDNPEREREVVIVTDNEDEDQVNDTTKVPIDPPIPDGDGDPERFVFRVGDDWEMVSTPLQLQNPEAASLLGDPNFIMYRFDANAGQYDAVSDMQLGRGYWLKASAMEKTMVGLSKPSYEWADLSGVGEPYGYGWNMIGSLYQPVDVSSIEQDPAGGLLSIFGWDPSQGYIVPTQIRPAKGYWVRVNPDTKLGISISSATGGSDGGGTTAYSKAVAGLDLAGMLSLENADGQSRRLYVAGANVTAETRNALVLPAAPPAGALDVRTTEQTTFVFPGESTVRIQGSGRHVLSTPVVSERIDIEVRDEDGRLLYTFDGTAGDHLVLDVSGTRMLKLRSRVRPAEASIALGSNYPNPFQTATSTVIPYTLSQDGSVRLTVYDMLGRQVRTLVRGSQSGGSRYVTWDGTDETGAAVPPGMYTYRLETAEGVVSRTLTIVK